jgi:hypothetical protein
MKNCICNKSDKVNILLLDLFVVSKHSTILRCIKCGGLIGEWTDKISPIKRGYSRIEQEVLK